ncbi:MAG: DUF3256 family protein [Prevotella sp.]|nr:DUF3256 family protein [Prevotella sp.]
MKRLNIIILLVCAPILVGAQISLRDVWLSMPDGMIPYLNKNLRLEHLDFVDMGVKSEVNHQLNGVSVMDTLTADYTHITLSKSSSLELRLLPVNDSTKIICVVRTFKAPAEESEIRFYDTDWNLLTDDYGLEKIKNQDNTDTEFLLSSFVQRPDTLSTERFEELCKLIEPVMVSASFDVAEPVLTFRLSVPLAVPDDREQLKSILRPRRFKWDGKVFVEI